LSPQFKNRVRKSVDTLDMLDIIQSKINLKEIKLC
jgi:hypothetical protein